MSKIQLKVDDGKPQPPVEGDEGNGHHGGRDVPIDGGIVV